MAAVPVFIAGASYWVADSVYYQKVNTGYVVTTPPVGARLKRLPAGAVVVHRNGRQYFHYQNIYYRWLPEKQLYVVELELNQESGYVAGTVLNTLPEGSNAVLINGVQYFRSGAAYFLPSERSGNTVYVVVVVVVVVD